MASVHGSKACCTIPPVSAQYTEDSNKFVQIAGMKTYRTGPGSSPLALILIYDIFGFGAQILQGADILTNSTSDKPEHQFQVFIPDFLQGEYADPAWFPPDKATPEGRMAMGKYFGPGGPANASVMCGKLQSVVSELKEKEPGIQKFGVVGYCWGAKIVSLSSMTGTAFSAAAEVHPSALTPSDASKVTIPMIVLASKEEDAATVKAFEEELKVPKFVDTYLEAPHGWMSSRGDLNDPQGKADYVKGYTAVLGFFHEHMTS